MRRSDSHGNVTSSDRMQAYRYGTPQGRTPACLSRTRLPPPCSALLSFRLPLSRASSAAPTTRPNTISASSSPRPTAGTSRSSLPAIPSPASIPTPSRAICCRPCKPPSRGRRSPSPTTAPVERPRPDYRLVLVFDPALDLGSDPVCRGVTRFKPGQPGLFYVYAVYCRNDQAMSETTAWTPATGPADPRIQQLFRELFQVVFSDSPALRPQTGGGDRR